MKLDTLTALLDLADAGTLVADIAERLNVSTGAVYSALREHRPDRTRSPRSCTSELRPMILGLLSRGIKPRRVAELCDCERQWVYKIKAGASL